MFVKNVTSCDALKSFCEKSVFWFDCFGEFFFLQFDLTNVMSFPPKIVFKPLASIAKNFAIKMNVRNTAM